MARNPATFVTGAQALPGYDYLTGWGVPRLTGLMTTLDGGTTPIVGTGGGGTTGGSTGGTTGGTTGGGPTPSLLPACPAFPQVVDVGGDATQVVLVDSGQAPPARPTSTSPAPE